MDKIRTSIDVKADRFRTEAEDSCFVADREDRRSGLSRIEERGLEMEISPIAGIRALPVVKAPPADPELTAVFDIDSSARIDEETWTPSDRKFSRGSEDDCSDDPLEEQQEAGDLGGEPETGSSQSSVAERKQISFFA